MKRISHVSDRENPLRANSALDVPLRLSSKVSIHMKMLSQSLHVKEGIHMASLRFYRYPPTEYLLHEAQYIDYGKLETSVFGHRKLHMNYEW